ALDKIGPPDKGDLSVLTGSLKDPKVEARLYAATSLGKMGAEAQSAAPALIDALKDSETSVRQAAARSLGKVGGDAKDQVLPALAETLKDADREVRVAAEEGLESLTPLTAADVPVLLKILDSKQPEARIAAAHALGK